jgi:peptidoglycan/LPS O-acetylase OafA/YrhL
VLDQPDAVRQHDSGPLSRAHAAAVDPGGMYWPQLDGVRAIAILLVLAVHMNSRLEGGILGVDLFFVLSGFLITTLLLQERTSTGRINVAHFYARRALRLLPALAVAIVLVAVVHGLPHAPATDLAFGIPVVLLYVTNWAGIYSGGRLGTLVPMWSLAIEEQFYLVWPWVIRRWAHARRLAEILVAIAMVMMLARTGWAVLKWRGSDRITFFRADGFLLGAALAVVLARREAVKALRALTYQCLAAVALVSLAVPWLVLFVRNGPVTRSVSYGYVSIAGAVLIGSVVMVPTSFVARALRTRPLVAIGRVSYGIYLFNFPIFALVQAQTWSTPVKLLVEYSATATLTLASWRLLEQPARRLRRRFRA